MLKYVLGFVLAVGLAFGAAPSAKAGCHRVQAVVVQQVQAPVYYSVPQAVVVQQQVQKVQVQKFNAGYGYFNQRQAFVNRGFVNQGQGQRGGRLAGLVDAVGRVANSPAGLVALGVLAGGGF